MPDDVHKDPLAPVRIRLTSFDCLWEFERDFAPLRDCVAIVISSRRREILRLYVAKNARSLADAQDDNMHDFNIATQSLSEENNYGPENSETKSLRVVL